MKTLAYIVIALTTLMIFTGVVMAADLVFTCPWGDEPQGFPISSFSSISAGHCIGHVILKSDVASEHVEYPTHNDMSYGTSTLATGDTEYALETHGISHSTSMSLNTQKAVINTGSMIDSESFGYQTINAPLLEGVADLTNSSCYMGDFRYLSMNSESSTITQLNLNTGNADAPVNMNYQMGISGTKEGSLARGNTNFAYGFVSRDSTGPTRFGGAQTWSGKYEFTHTITMVITP